MIDWIKRNLNEESLAVLSALALEYGASLLGAIALIVAALIASGWARRATLKALGRVKFDETLTKFAGEMARWLVLLLGVVLCLGAFGVDTTSVAGVLTGASLAIGLAFQGSLSNIAAGVMLLTFRPFVVGQFIQVAGETGTVEEISLFATTLNTPDRKHIIIPNGKVFGATITNFSHNPTRRVDVDIGLSYEADLDYARATLIAAAESAPSRLQGEVVVAVITSFASSSVNWQVRVIAESALYLDVQQEVMRALKRALDEAQIAIPLPQLVLHRAEPAPEP